MPNPPSQNPSPCILSLTLVLSTLLSISGCSASYIPKRDGRVAIVMKDGAIGYSRDGRVHKHGLFGGGLLKAVRGVPAAEKAARTHRNRLGWGFVGVMGGLVCSSVALVAAVGDPSTPERDGSDAAAITSLACLGASMVGMGYMISAVPYQYDAVNIFNDSLVPTGTIQMPGQFPSQQVPASQPGQGAPGQYP